MQCLNSVCSRLLVYTEFSFIYFFEFCSIFLLGSVSSHFGCLPVFVCMGWVGLLHLCVSAGLLHVECVLWGAVTQPPWPPEGQVLQGC